ncbi:MAG: DUF1800 domain-containing protein [Lysobacteraceae bacterium]|nr:MAG: DUF1800 domain-containing protein [Xanthomonadaceae bacterium]
MSGNSIAAVNRFGLGARPGELAQVREAREWLQAQLRTKPDLSAFAALPGSATIMRRQTEYLLMRRREQSGAAAPEQAQPRSDDMPEAAQPLRRRRRDQGDGEASMRTPLQNEIRRDALAEITARYGYAATTDRPFVERLVRFWSNHFAVSADKNQARLLAAPMEREAVRPHVLGRFVDMLTAVERHPAMLQYLDNSASVGEGSTLAKMAERRTKRDLGLNENLAREILELHTLGVDGGYRQQDVIELARAITGWGTPLPRDVRRGDAPVVGFVFRPGAHEPGARTVLGRRYAEGGETQGLEILRDLALHPSTARHLSLKLARHFVADAPPQTLVRRMSDAYLRSDGDLTAMYRAMIEDDAAWNADARKFKTPDDYVVSAMRAGGLRLERRPFALARLLESLGQPIFTPRSPAGFPDTAADWASGDALRKRLQAAAALAEQIAGARQPYAMAVEALGESSVDGEFGQILRRAGSAQEGYALLFSSPAFQWRV